MSCTPGGMLVGKDCGPASSKGSGAGLEAKSLAWAVAGRIAYGRTVADTRLLPEGGGGDGGYVDVYQVFDIATGASSTIGWTSWFHAYRARNQR